MGINYSPEHTGIAPYTTRACQYLRGQGAQVLVLSGVPHYPHWLVPAAYRRRLRVDEVRENVAVRRLRHFVPARQSALSRATYEATFGLNVLAQPLPWRPDVVLAVVPSLLGAAAAAVLARRQGAPLVVWAQDLMGPATTQSGIAGGSQIAAATSRLERLLLRQASAVVVIHEAFVRYAERAGVPSDRVHVLPNWTHMLRPIAIRSETRARLGWQPDEVVVLHSGNMGLKQGLENVVEAARIAPILAQQVRFVLMGDGSQRQLLQDLGRGLPALTFLPSAAADEFPDVLAAADVLLVNERASAVDMSVPSKLTSYFRAGRPVVAAVPRLGSTAREVKRSGGGTVVGPEDARLLLAGIVAITQDDLTAKALAASGRSYAEGHLDEDRSLAALGSLLGSLLLRPSPDSTPLKPLVGTAARTIAT